MGAAAAAADPLLASRRRVPQRTIGAGGAAVVAAVEGAPGAGASGTGRDDHGTGRDDRGPRGGGGWMPEGRRAGWRRHAAGHRGSPRHASLITKAGWATLARRRARDRRSGAAGGSRRVSGGAPQP